MRVYRKRPIVKTLIVRKKRPLKYRLLYLAFFMFFCIMIFMIVFYDASGTLLGISGALLFLFGLGLEFANKNITEGHLVLFFSKIIINQNNVKKEFYIKDLNKVRFKLEGFKGDGYMLNPNSVTSKDGTGNFIEFEAGKEEYSFELLIKRAQSKRLYRIFNQWEKEYPNFKLIDGSFW